MHAHLQLACPAQPHVINSGQLGNAIAGLVHGDATHVAADQLVRVKVHITVTHAAPVPRPSHLQLQSKQGLWQLVSSSTTRVSYWGGDMPVLQKPCTADVVAAASAMVLLERATPLRVMKHTFALRSAQFFQLVHQKLWCSGVYDTIVWSSRQCIEGGLHKRYQRTLMGLTSPFLIANQGSKGGGGPFSSFGGLGCNDTALLISDPS